MTLRDLAARLKKSVSGLFPPFNQGNTASDDPVRFSTQDTEDATLDLEDFSPRGRHINHSCPDFKKLPRTNDSPSKRDRLLGTLRKGSLRKIASFRNLRSPSSRLKLPDHPAHSTAEEAPTTPRHDEKPTLILNFAESPPGQLVFEVPLRRSMSSSLFVHHSSPLPVPSSSKVDARFNMPIHSSTLPAGTVPTSPAPLQRALEMDPHTDTPSWPSSPVVEPSTMAGPFPTPIPGTNLTFEDLRSVDTGSPKTADISSPGYFDLALSPHNGSFPGASLMQAGAWISGHMEGDIEKLSSNGNDTTISSGVDRSDSTNTNASTSSTQNTWDTVSTKHAANDKVARPYIMSKCKRSLSSSCGSALSLPPETHLFLGASLAPAWHTDPALYDGSGYGDSPIGSHLRFVAPTRVVESTPCTSSPPVQDLSTGSMVAIIEREKQRFEAILKKLKDGPSAELVAFLKSRHDNTEVAAILQGRPSCEESLESIYGAYASLEGAGEESITPTKKSAEEAKTEFRFVKEVRNVSLGS